MNPFKERHRLLFQFKDFALKAVNGQFMRAMSNRERDDIMAALYSMATNAASYYGLTVARSYALYPNDEEKRKEFMERQANPERLALAGFIRMSLLAPLSFASDAFEATTGTPMFRTTVDNSMRPKDPDWSTYSIGQRVGKGLSEQLPAVATAVRTAGAMTAGASLMTGNGTQKDIDDALRGLPLGTWYGLIAAGSLIKGDSTLPENKREAKKPQTAKNPLMQLSGNNKTQKKRKKTKVSNPMMSLTPKKNNKESLLDQLKG